MARTGESERNALPYPWPKGVMALHRADAMELLRFCAEKGLTTFYATKDQGAFIGAGFKPRDKVFYMPECDPALNAHWQTVCDERYGPAEICEYLPLDVLNTYFNNPVFAQSEHFILRFRNGQAMLVREEEIIE